jgi:recombination protein RecA
VTLGVIEKRGSFYTVGEQRIGQGRENARQTLKDNPALMQDLDARVRAGFKPEAAPADMEG